MQGLYRIARKDKGAAVEVLHGAFGEEIETMVRRYKLKRHVAEGLFQIPLDVCLTKGEVFASSEAMEGLMAFTPGERSDFSLPALIASGAFFKSLGALGLMTRKDFGPIFARLGRDKKALTIGPYYYLAVLGVSPRQQGKGIGSRLLSALCARADAENRAIYLETQNAPNVSWYGRFGFETHKKLGLPGSIEIWEMIRRQA